MITQQRKPLRSIPNKFFPQTKSTDVAAFRSAWGFVGYETISAFSEKSFCFVAIDLSVVIISLWHQAISEEKRQNDVVN